MEEKRLTEVIDSLPLGWFHYRLLLVCGLCFCADSMEVALLSYISICAGIEWNLSHYEVSMIAGAVFVGTLVGNVIFGPVADRYGRRGTFFVACVTIIIAGTASAFAPNLVALILLRTICGIGIGGVVIPFDLLAEFMPTQARGKVLSMIGYFWTGGSILISGLSWIILPRSNWHNLTFVAAIPVTISLLFGIFTLPESPRWLLIMGRKDEATEVLRKAALYNGTALGDVTVSSEPQSQTIHHSPFVLLFQRNSMVLTLSVWSHWFFYGFSYYAVVLFSIRIFTHGNSQSSDQKCSFHYDELLIGSLSESIGVLICTLVIDRYGRLPTLRWSYGLCAVFALILGLSIHHLPLPLVSFLSYLSRLSILCGVSATWLSTPEFFPTSTRVTAHAVASGISRVGSFIAPFIAQSFASIQEVAFIISMSCIFIVLTTLFLPENIGLVLEDSNVPKRRKLKSRLNTLLPSNPYQILDEKVPNFNGDFECDEDVVIEL